MKSSSKDGLAKLTRRPPNFLIMLMAVGVATIMWYFVSIRDRLEAQVEINLDYTGIPANLMVTDGLVSKMTVRLRGPQTLLRSIPREKLNQTIDLSKIKKGENAVPLSGDGLGASFRAFDVVDIQPPRIVVKADNFTERNVPVRYEIESPLRENAFTVGNVSVDPGNVVISGPEEVISKISWLPLVIRPDPSKAGSLPESQRITLDTPSLVSATPSAVNVTYTITSGRATIARECPVTIVGDQDNAYEVKPNQIAFRIEVPEALAKNAQYLKQLEVSVVPPPMRPGEKTRVRLRVRAPEGMIIKNQSQMEVELTKNVAEDDV